MRAERIILLAAGGTAGHLYPAGALARALQGAGFAPHLATDKRGLAYIKQIESVVVHRLPAASLFGKSILSLPARVFTLGLSLIAAFYLVLKLRPVVVVGFGGYPSFAPVAMALLLRKPALIHEQNAVLGRANRYLAKLGAHLATGFAHTSNIPKRAVSKSHRTGNPLRASVYQAAQSDYRPTDGTQPFNLLIFGGSQGAYVFTDIVPQAIGTLPQNLQHRLRVIHQVRKPDISRTLSIYGSQGIDVEIRDYFEDMPARMRKAHLVICRGGASTISELITLGVPAIIVPLPSALDQDQARNAAQLVEAGGAWVMPQDNFTAEALAAQLSALMQNETRLTQAATCAKTLATPDAAQRLAHYVERLAGGSQQ